ncbi:ATP-dependent DNA helicase RecG [Nakamurella aerolata]|uniref:Probable DNA 3'-5' helicase RecG n=1 Tax=Nakamurella aerolata TaxID=1656892 RepID=A0A849AD93_9ACTN|nr:ATP-dependent DNA helicase RecG [Nakamurella aerolata]NNG37171.1 ATP-dependent DNA helicase RecG [Nakamurella aerolata]
MSGKAGKHSATLGLDSPLRDAGIPQRLAGNLDDKLGLRTVGDLLRYYPRRHTERGNLTDLSHLREGERATIWARIVSVTDKNLPPRSGRKGGVRLVTRVVVGDGNRQVTCAFFNQYHVKRVMRPGMEAMFAGTVKRFNSELQLSSPSYAVLSGGDSLSTSADADIETLEEFSGIIPIYPLTEGITQKFIQQAVRVVLELVGTIEDPVPQELLATRGLTDLDTALRNIHRPVSDEALAAAKRRLKYDEALAVQLALAQRRHLAKEFPAPACPPRADGLLAAFDAQLPFILTNGQRTVGKEIAAELSRPHPMNRLLQGEVGSGKTLVALRAMLQVIDSGHQAALLAPTEVLAAQHARSLREMLGPLGAGGELGAAEASTSITLLTGSLTAAARKKALLQIASGEAGIIVGTHALLSDPVMFAGLGLVVVDEQHRFGVEQRDALRSKGSDSAPPHVLVMTATPIPRTVAMTVYGDLETSTMRELPRGRSPIATTVVPTAEKPAWLGRAWQRIREEVENGHQVYVVCPKISQDAAQPGKARALSEDDGGDWDDPALLDDGADEKGRRAPLSVEQVADLLRNGPLQGLRLAELHGRMPPVEKDAVMQDFGAGLIDVLVSTTVIEVGVDVPNATMMVVVDAERFGLSQLHQLRGRVGRGSAPGVCLLLTDSPAGSTGRQRLDALASTPDGFQLAEKDLELRREGNVLGTSQAGRASSLKLLSLVSDREVVQEARSDAQSLVADQPDLDRFPGLAAMVATVIDEDDQDFLIKG